MAANITYHEQTDIDNIRKLREVLKTLPAFAKDYFRAIEPTTSTKTRISYAYDIRIFFQFLISQNPSLAKIGIPNLNVSVLDQLKPIDIEEYMEYLKLYDSPNDQTTITNGERGLKRKISSLRSFYTYYYKRQAIETNQVQLVDMPRSMTKPLSASTPVKRLHCWIILNTAVINSLVSEKLITKKQNCVILPLSLSCLVPVSVYLNVSDWMWKTLTSVTTVFASYAKAVLRW